MILSYFFIILINDYVSFWLNNTDTVIIKTKNGFLLYGEILLCVEKGEKVLVAKKLGNIFPVLKQNTNKNPVNMLHFEMNSFWEGDAVIWNLNEDKPLNLLDPFDYLHMCLKFDKNN